MTSCLLIAPAMMALLIAPAFPQGASFGSYMPELKRLQQNGDAAGMERLARKAQAELQARLGPDNIEVAAAVTWVGIALHAQSRNTEAEPLLRRALAIREKALGPSHLDVAVSLNNLAQVLLLVAEEVAQVLLGPPPVADLLPHGLEARLEGRAHALVHAGAKIGTWRRGVRVSPRMMSSCR